MVNIIIRGGATLHGSIKAPPSKSYTHRAIVASLLSHGESRVHNALLCDDTMATINACKMLGAEIMISGNEIRIHGTSRPETPRNIINCGESGSTIRFITPVCALADGSSILMGNESLKNRPMDPLLNALNQLGVKSHLIQGNSKLLIIVLGGGIRGGKAEIRGDISSQFISGLLFATPLAHNDTFIHLLTPLESKPYVDMTMDTLVRHGIRVSSHNDLFYVPCGQEYKPYDHIIEGDYSSASFLLAAAALTRSHVRIEGLLRNSLQGDRRIVSILSNMGAIIKLGQDYVEVNGVEGRLRPIEINMKDTPDLVPVCAVLACFAEGRSVISGVRRLRFKESDRIETLMSELTKMGALIKFVDNSLIIDGRGHLHGAEVDSHRDHRIAMACAVAALGADGETIIRDIECVNKSYPNFITDMCLLGAEVFEQ